MLSTSALANAQQTILVLGDSLSAGYGLTQGTGWVSLLDKKLQSYHPSMVHYNVVNSSISGETTQGGVSRLPTLLAQHHPQILILALGANDGLRGFSLALTRNNLAQMIRLTQKKYCKVLLVGTQLPPNYGKRYSNEFSKLYLALAKQYKTALVPSLFSGFASDLSYFQEDRLHPNQKAQEQIVMTIWKVLQPLLH